MFKFLRKKKPEKSQFEHLNENLKTTDFRVAFDALEAGHRVEIVAGLSIKNTKKHVVVICWSQTARLWFTPF